MTENYVTSEKLKVQWFFQKECQKFIHGQIFFFLFFDINYMI